MSEEVLSRGLPKWPQMVVTGMPLPWTRAKEVIRRTDSFIGNGSGGNDYEWNRAAAKLLKMPHLFDMGPKEASDDKPERNYQEEWDLQEKWLKKWGYVQTEYVRNSWLSEAFIFGPHGWCHPDGHIGFTDNVGKWPSCDAIKDDWQTLSSAFPFLDIGVTMMSGEDCNVEANKPVISFRVVSGEVTTVDPREHDVHRDHPPSYRGLHDYEQRDTESAAKRLMTSPDSREHGVPWGWLEDWAKMIDHG